MSIKKQQLLAVWKTERISEDLPDNEHMLPVKRLDETAIASDG